MKVLIHFDEPAYNADISRLNNLVKPKIATVITAYNTLGLPALVTADLGRLFHDLKPLIIEKMINGQPLLLAGVPVTREKAIDLFEMPAGYENLQKVIKEAQGWDNLPADSFEIAAGVLQLKEGVRAMIEEGWKYYATSQKQLDVAAEVAKIVDALNALKGKVYYGSNSDTHGRFVSEAIKNKGAYAPAMYTLNPYFITKIL